MSATVHAFPAFAYLNSPRSWILAAILLLHAAFLWSLSNGLSRSIITFVEPRTVVDFIPEEIEPLPPPPPPREFRPQVLNPVPPGSIPILGPVGEDAITVPEARPQPIPQPVPETRPAPVLVQPQIDPARPLSEPAYPPQDVRIGNTGTVLLSVLVLPDGRVGEVRLDRSSGHSRLDASALSEARQWRFKPGTQDGTAIPMWKQLPITFRLQD